MFALLDFNVGQVNQSICVTSYRHLKAVSYITTLLALNCYALHYTKIAVQV